jgi:hypothetical protein
MSISSCRFNARQWDDLPCVELGRPVFAILVALEDPEEMDENMPPDTQFELVKIVHNKQLVQVVPQLQQKARKSVLLPNKSA